MLRPKEFWLLFVVILIFDVFPYMFGVVQAFVPNEAEAGNIIALALIPFVILQLVGLGLLFTHRKFIFLLGLGFILFGFIVPSLLFRHFSLPFYILFYRYLPKSSVLYSIVNLLILSSILIMSRRYYRSLFGSNSTFNRMS